MNIEIKDKNIFVNGVETVVVAGEVHYFRLKPEKWQEALTKLKEAGFNAVATYIPWFVHQQTEDQLDITGKYNSQYDIVSFLKLVEENDLLIIPRPGPFIMAELMGDGIPLWVKEKHPGCLPMSWDNKLGTTVDLDYMEAGFLEEADKWLQTIIPVIAEYQGRNLIGTQIDNEMGMLSWVSNNPILNDNSTAMLSEFIDQKYPEFKATLNISNDSELKQYVQSPKGENEVLFHRILHEFTREKFVIYTNLLVASFKKYGLDNSKFFINIHGTDQSRLGGYPIGISQLYKTYQDNDELISGSDIYFDNLNSSNIHDTYLAAIYTEAFNNENQPLTTLEYNGSNSDFELDNSKHALARANHHRARMLLGQGTKLFNYYLFSGGTNWLTNTPIGDGIDRIATTAENHGWCSPLRSDLSYNYQFNEISNFGHTVSNLQNKIGAMQPKLDKIAIGFIPEYFADEYCYPQADEFSVMRDKIRRDTKDYANNVLYHYLILKNYLPFAIDLENKQLNVENVETLALNTTYYMSEKIQSKISAYIKNGGKFIFYGPIPIYDMYGNECTILRDTLKLKHKKTIDHYDDNQRLAIEPIGIAADVPTSFHNYAEIWETKYNTIPVLSVYETGDITGVIIDDEIHGCIIPCEYKCNIELFDIVFAKLNISKILRVETTFIGTFINVLENNNKETLINIINTDDISREVQIEYDELSLDIQLEPLEARLLPVNLQNENYTLCYATNEIVHAKVDSLKFKLAGNTINIQLETNCEICLPDNYAIKYEDNKYTITTISRQYGEDYLEITFKERTANEL